VRSTKRCRHCILGYILLFESSVLDFDMQPLPPNSCGMYSVHCKLRRYSQSGYDRDEMVEIKKSRVSCFLFSIFINNLIQSEAGLAKAISNFVSDIPVFVEQDIV
jgi:hypothetical protein